MEPMVAGKGGGGSGARRQSGQPGPAVRGSGGAATPEQLAMMEEEQLRRAMEQSMAASQPHAQPHPHPHPPPLNPYADPPEQVHESFLARERGL